MRKLFAVALLILPILLAHAGSTPDNDSQDSARPRLQLDIDVPGRAAPVHDGWSDVGHVRWIVAPRSSLESTSCKRPPVPPAAFLAIDSKGTIYFDGLATEIWRLWADGRLQSRNWARDFPATVEVAIAAGRNDEMWIGDTNRHLVEVLNDDGALQPVAGRDGHVGHVDGFGSGATFGIISAIAADPSGGILVADGELVRRVTPNGQVSTIAGSHPAEEGQDASRRRARDGQGLTAVFGGIGGLAASPSGDIYVTDTVGRYSAIRRIDKSGMVTTLIDAAHSKGAFRSLGRIAVDSDGALLVVDNDDRGERNRPRLVRLDPSGRIRTRFDPALPAGRYDPKNSGIWGFVDMALDSRTGRAYATDYLATTIHRIDPNGEAYTPCFESIKAPGR